ncbi:MAG: polysaccharide deacetylase family protein [Acidobacteria bacterium]|nr:MAG: polysaccharide deacetylase family protein [Acidobacteriota bacterium]
MSVNGKARDVSAYATVGDALRGSPEDWPPSDRVDVEGNLLDKVQVTPSIWVNGSSASLDTPTAPYSRIVVVAPAQVSETTSTEVSALPFDSSPHIWSRLWAEGAPGSASVAVGSISGKRSAPVVVSAPVPARSLADEATAALTFDDGPDPTWTPVVLDILKEKGVKATFFVLGGRAQAYPDLIRRAAADGHSIQNHSWNHPPAFGLLPFEVVFDEMNGTSAEIETITGKRPTFFRPPGGGLSADVEAASGQLGMKLAMWNVDPQDWAGNTAEGIYARVTQGLGGGDMILLHDGGGDRGQTTAALPGIIDDLRNKGFTFVTL